MPDESLDGSPRRSNWDTLDFLGVVKGAGEEDREMELDFSIKIVDVGGLSPVGLAEVEVRLREEDHDPGSAVRVAFPEKLDESTIVEDEENQFSGFARSYTTLGDVFMEVIETP